MAKPNRLALSLGLTAFLILCTLATAESAIDENPARILAETNLIDKYSIFLNGATPVLEQGVLKDPFKATVSQLKDLINKPNATFDGLTYVSVDSEQFFQLYITSTERTKPEYKLEVTATPGLGVRIVDTHDELWEHTSGSMEAFYHFTFKEYTRNEKFWVQFFCEKDGNYLVNFVITPNPDVAFSLSSTKHAPISFNTVKTCVRGVRNDFLFTPMDLWKNTIRSEPFHLLELLSNDTTRMANITYKMARTYFEVSVFGPGQIIIQPEIRSLDTTLGVALLGKGVKGGIATSTDKLEFIFSFECYKKEGVGKGENDTDLRKFEFSFLPPPFDKVDVPMYVDCRHFEEGKTFFPFNVETRKDSKDVIYQGKTVSTYQLAQSQKGSNKQAQIVGIDPEVGASEFYIYLEPHPPSANKSADDFEFDWFEKVDAIASTDILEPEIVNIPTRGLALTKTVQRMVLVYNCKRAGVATVTVSFHQHDHGYDFSVIKNCPLKAEPKSTSGFWRFLFAAGVIFFGCFLVTVLRALIQKENSTSKDYTPTATSKRKSETELSTTSENGRAQSYDDNI